MSMTKRGILEPLLEAQGYGSHVGYVPHSEQEIKAAQERHRRTLYMRDMDNIKPNTNSKPKQS